jgi:hypothetical protein
MNSRCKAAMHPLDAPVNQDLVASDLTTKSVRLLSERDGAISDVIGDRRRLLSSLAAIPILMVIAVLTPYEEVV